MIIALRIMLAIAAIVTVAYVYCVVHCIMDPSCQIEDTYTILISVAFATLGVLYQMEQNRVLSRKQHTISVLFGIRFSDYFNKQLEVTWANLGRDDPIDLHYIQNASKYRYNEESSYQRDFELIMSARAITNYYEFIAASLRHKDLDEKLSKETIGPMVCGWVKRAHLYIQYARREIDEEGHATGVTQAEVFNNVLWLYERWKEECLPEQRT